MKIVPKILSIAVGVLLILLAAGYTSFWCVHDLIETNKTAMKTVRILRELENLLGRVLDVESTVRGYIMTGDTVYYEPNEAAKKEVSDSVATLKELTRDDSSRAKFVDELLPLINEKIEYCLLLAKTMKANGSAAALSLFKSERGHTLMDEIRHKVSDRVTIEENVLHNEIEISKSTANNTFFAAITGGILALVFVSVWSYIIAQGITNPINRLISGTEKVGAGRFENVIGIDSKDELGELSTAFNQMVSNLRKIEETYLGGPHGKPPIHSLALVKQHANSFHTLINDMTEASNQLSVSFENQPEEMNLALERARSMSDSASEVNELLTGILLLLSRSDELGHAGHKTLEEIDEQVTKVVQEADSSIGRIKSLAEKLQTLDGLSVTMDDISNRVNLISLSSQIEANKGGNSADVFGTELRFLAESTRQESLKVKHILSSMERTVDKATSENENAQEVMHKATHVINQLHTKLDDLLNPISTASQKARMLDEKLERQKAQLLEFQNLLERANITSEQKQFFIKQICSTANEVNNFGAQLNSLLENGSPT